MLALSVIIIGFSGLAFLGLPWLLHTPVLSASTPLPDAGVIIHWITLAQSRADQRVVALYQQGHGKKIICVSTPVSWDVYAADFTRQHLLALGVPAENVLTLHLPLEACPAPNERRVAQYVKAQGWQSVLLVTDPIVMSSRMRKYFQQEGINVALTCVQEDQDELMRQWWKTHWKIQWITKSAFGILLDSAYAECR